MNECRGADLGHLDLPIESKTRVGLGRTACVRECLDDDRLAVVAKLDAGMGDTLSRPGDVRVVRHVDEAARAPGLLNRDAKLSDNGVESLYEGQSLLAAIGVVPVFAHGPQVVLPEGGDRAAQTDCARLHTPPRPLHRFRVYCGNEP